MLLSTTLICHALFAHKFPVFLLIVVKLIESAIKERHQAAQYTEGELLIFASTVPTVSCKSWLTPVAVAAAVFHCRHCHHPPTNSTTKTMTTGATPTDTHISVAMSERVPTKNHARAIKRHIKKERKRKNRKREIRKQEPQNMVSYATWVLCNKKTKQVVKSVLRC